MRLPDTTYRMRTGLAAGLRKRGGLGLRQRLGLWHPDSDAEDDLLKSRDLEGGVVYDVGAFEGIHAIFFASRVGPAGRVVCFEPHPGNRARARRNVELNGFANVELREEAVGDGPGEVVLNTVEGQGGRSSADPQIGRSLAASGEVVGLRVPVTSVDAVVAAGAPAPSFVKVDVEGLEDAVVAGMADTLRTVRPEVLIEIHGGDAAAKAARGAAVAGALLDAGYTVRHVETGAAVTTPGEAPRSGHLHGACA